MYETITTSQQDSSLVITLNRKEKRNAISLKTMDDIIVASSQAENDPEVSNVIITGGREFFSAGADLNEAFKVSTPLEGRAYFGAWHKLCDHLETLRLPVIAAIEGFCFTGGLELALACDLRIGGEGSSYAITSSRIGTVAGAGGTQRLPRLVGPGYALEIMLTAEPIDGARAKEVGLLNHLTPSGNSLSKALEIGAIFAERAPISLAYCKRAVHRGLQMDMASALEFETYLVTTVYGTKDKAEGIGAFLEKRKPVFRGE